MGGGVTVVLGAGVDTGTVHAVMIRVSDELALVTHVTGTAETGGANNAWNLKILL